MVDDNDVSKWKETVLSVLEGETSRKKGKGDDDKSSIKVKTLRKLVLMSFQLDNDDKAGKSTYKKAVQDLEDNNCLEIDEDGLMRLTKQQRKRKKNDGDDDKKSKKNKKKTKSTDDDDDDDANNNDSKEDNETKAISKKEKNVPCKGNSDGHTRLFLGNLPFAVDEASLKEFMPGTVTHIKWITDQATGKFYGSAFIEMDISASAATAVGVTAGTKLLGRPIKITYAPSRPGDIWPPGKDGSSSNGKSNTSGHAGGSGTKAMAAKPDDCKKLFVGNLSYEIDDEAITKFFEKVNAEVKAVRWIHHKDSGDFKGVGFVEFWKTDACERAATLNGKDLLGRPIRIDWTD